MTTNQTIDGVPRELALRLLLANGSELAKSRKELRALLDKSDADIPASVPQGEPVAWIKPDVAKTLTKDECCYAFGSQNPKGTLIPLYAGRPEDK